MPRKQMGRRSGTVALMALLLNLSDLVAHEPAFGGPCDASGSTDVMRAFADEAINDVILSSQATAPTARTFGKLPLSFIRNRGQSDVATRFEVRGQGFWLSLEQGQVVMAVASTARLAEQQPSDFRQLRMKLIGANPLATLSGEDELPGKFHYFIGNDPTGWRTNVQSFAKVRYHDIYPAIDLVFYGNEGQLEYDFVLAPGADPDRIQFAIEGADRVEVDPKGDLRLVVADQELRWRQPMTYQERNGRRVCVEGEYALRPILVESSGAKAQRVAFHIAPYDRTLALVIDPVLVYGTFLGASDDATYGTSIATGPEGCVYVVGRTASSSFPTQGALMPTNSGAGWSFYPTKLDATGQMVYSTYVGPIGDSPQFPKIAVDQSGSVYMAGFSSSPTFPTVNAVQPAFGGGTQEGDAIVMKLVPDGSALVYSTYLGGSGNDYASGIAVDKEGAAYVTGSTASFNFPRTNAVQTTYRGSGDAFVAKLNPEGTALVYSTYFGGSGGEFRCSVAVDSEGNTFIAGQTSSTDLSTRSPFQERFGGGFGDGFWAKLSPGGDTILSASYFGGTLVEGISGMAVGSDGDIYVTGFTYSQDFPIAKAIQPQNHAVGGPPPFNITRTAFLARYSMASNSLVFSTYLGGSVTDEAVSVALDEMDNVYVCGVTLSPDFPTTDSALQGWNNGGSALYGVGFESFLSVLASDGSKLLYSSYLGGTGNDYDPYVAVDRSGNVYLTGSTTSADFPIAQPLLPYSGPTSAYLVKINPIVPGPPLLQISQVVNAVRVSWPENATNYVLEAATSLPAISWATVTNTPTVTATNRSVELPLTGPAQFFRLRQP